MRPIFSLTNETTSQLPAGFAKIANRLLQITVKEINREYEAISLVIIESKTIRYLNKKYRKHDKVTDVLSFILESKPVLGEIVICLRQASKQAARQQHSLTKELIILTIHGLVHLFGYDHIKLKDRKIMRPLEQKILHIYDRASHKK